MFGLNPVELLVVGSVCIFPLLVFPAWKLCVRVGLSGWLSLLIFVPGGLIALLFVLAFIEWPIDRR